MSKSNKLISLGVDPGLKGQYAVVECLPSNVIQLRAVGALPFRNIAGTENCFDINQFRLMIKQYFSPNTIYAVEKQQARMGRGVGTRMTNYGMVLSSLLVASINEEKVFAMTPQGWQTLVYSKEDLKETDPKKRSKKKAYSLFGIELYDDNMTDAVLIAVAGVVLKRGKLMPHYTFNYTKDEEILV